MLLLRRTSSSLEVGMRILRSTKDWLSRVRETSWHYRLVDSMLESVPKKACSYYWYGVPAAMIKGGLMLIVAIVVCFIGWFCGFMPILFNKAWTGNGAPFLNYKMRFDGTRRPLAPWEFTLISLVLIELYEWYATGLFLHQSVGAFSSTFFWSGVVLAVIIFLGLVGWIMYRKRNAILRKLDSAGDRASMTWDRVCPPLVVEKSPKQ